MEKYLNKYGFAYKEIGIMDLIKSISKSIDEEDSSSVRDRSIFLKSEKHRSNNLILTDRKVFFTENQWTPRHGLDLIFEIECIPTGSSVSGLKRGEISQSKIELSLRHNNYSLRQLFNPKELETANEYELRINKIRPTELYFSQGSRLISVSGITSVKLVKIGFPIPIMVGLGLTAKEKIYEVEEPLTFMKPYLEVFEIKDLYLSSSSNYIFQTVTALDPNWYKEVVFFNEMKDYTHVKIIVPYQYVIKHHDLYQFNESSNEALLMPYTRKSPLKTHVFWRSIPEAALYTVEYFIYNRRDYLHSLYFMKKEILDKDSCTSSFEALAQGSYIVRISAEDRIGTIIAKSRGIFVNKDSDISYPQDWLENIINDIVVM